jgi:oxygen-independent coproporphyrinogen-3 oxidase
LSAYVLTVEPRTALGVRVARGLEREAPEAAVEAAYRHLCEEAAGRGWAHYEVSNFAPAGGEAVHNARYWEGVPYLGIGPGAHGFTGQIRYANRPNNPLYLKAIRSGDALPEDRETLTRTDRYNEQLMTGLRTARGIDLHALDAAFGMRPDRAEAAAWEAAVKRGDLVEAGGRWRIPELRWLVGDAIAAELFTLAD